MRRRSADRRAGRLHGRDKVRCGLLGAAMKALVLVFSVTLPATCLRSQLYDCAISFVQLPESFIRFSIQHLVLSYDSAQVSAQVELEEFHHSDSIEKFNASRLNPNLPFAFFINGFNTDGNMTNFWMGKMARVLTQHNYMAVTHARPVVRANILLLEWHIPGLTGSALWDMILAYYRTLGNYDQLVSQTMNSLAKVVEFVEEARANQGGWKSAASRLKYYSQFRFYGHSLGAHIIADAVHLFQANHRPELKFKRMVGYDPALPCFASLSYGISYDKLAKSVDQLMVIHSNAGFSGSTLVRGPIEVVLNGGTFQPGCSWYQMSCHHMRSSDLFEYYDDECMLVAYRCSKYEQFKLGACETNEFSNLFSREKELDEPGRAVRAATLDYVSVNLEELHIDSYELTTLVNNRRVRQLAEEIDDEGYELYMMKVRRAWKLNDDKSNGELAQIEGGQKDRKDDVRQFHFVSTNPDFASNSHPSHCLQHYQARLVILQHSDSSETLLKNDCSRGNFLTANSDGLKISLISEEDLMDLEPKQAESTDESREGTLLNYFALNAIIDESLHTGLITYKGKPKLFVGAILDNIDFDRWSACLKAKRIVNRGFTFVLDIAFMSHTNQNVRQALSTVLCGHWNPHLGGNQSKQANDELILRLCRQSELRNVSTMIDEQLKQVKFQHQYDSWAVGLVDSLFLLFSGWEPL